MYLLIYPSLLTLKANKFGFCAGGTRSAKAAQFTEEDTILFAAILQNKL